MMTVEELYEAFEKATEERPCNYKLHDIDGFLHLKNLGWGSRVGDIISAAEHDQIWLNVDVEWLAEVATIEDINYLVDCGINADEDYESLYMFV